MKEETEDRLSSLPDDVIIGILSRLPLKTAIVTGVLSSLWRGLWTHVTSIHDLELKWPHCQAFIVPSFVFQSPSLVSIELRGDFRLLVEGNAINLPKLKKLTLEHHLWRCESIQNLINGCPSLEELSLELRSLEENALVKCTSSSLRRLFIVLKGSYTKVVINAPKLEYLSACAASPIQVCFDHKPTGLRETKIDGFHRLTKIRPMLKLCKAMSNVTRLTLAMQLHYDLGTALLSLKHCLALEVLVLNFGYGKVGYERWIDQKCELIHALRRVKTIVIDTCDVLCFERTRYLSDLVKYLLMNASGLEQFNFCITKIQHNNKGINHDYYEAKEHLLCDLLFKCPKLSLGCEVKFVGTYLTMSRNAGPKVWRANGEVVHLDCIRF